MSSRIEVGDRLPEVRAQLVSGDPIVLPDAVEDGWAVVLLYRGHWCPYCRRQLVDFQRALPKFEAAGVRVLALSADTATDARTTVEVHGIEFPVGYGLAPDEIRARLGAYVAPEGRFIQATGFVLGPGGSVQLAVYSSGAVGRLVAADVLGLIEYAHGHA